MHHQLATLFLALGLCGCYRLHGPDGADDDASNEDDCHGACGDDLDGDGWAAALDCNDLDPHVSPDAVDSGCCTGDSPCCTGNGIDDDCDGNVDNTWRCDPDCGEPDHDGDGVDSSADCNDFVARIHPGALDCCGADGVDDDCDGVVDDVADAPCDCAAIDADLDGWPAAVDCNDQNRQISPGLVERCCDLLDNDCDETTDDCCHGRPL